MKYRNKILVNLVASAMLVLLVACGEKGVTSEYEAEARERAVVAAKELLECNRKNIMQLEEAILNVKAIQSEYLLKGDTIAWNAFDDSFRRYVQANDSVFAKLIFKE